MNHISAGANAWPRQLGRGSALRLALVGTYTPRRCGIATFTTDVREKLARYQPAIQTDVYALDNAAQAHRYDGIAQTIDAADPAAYRAAAAAINASGADAVWLQHEYGIFGGPDGEMVLELAERIAAPLILTLHTVLEQPNANQRRILERLIARASRIMVMARHSRDLLIATHRIDPERIAVIEHGAPDRAFGRMVEAKAAQGLDGRTVIMTFGLLGPGKGLEHAIEAMPAVVARHPEALYRIVGATHPNLVAEQGEAYRDSLLARVEALGLSEHVVFEDRFLETDELLNQLDACDVYLTPYPNLQQSTSGTLSYAVALGKAVVSTPYIHARELLADGVGMLVPPCDSGAIAEAVNTLLDDRTALAAMQRRAYERGRATVWPRFAAAAARLVGSVAAPRLAGARPVVRPNPCAVYAMTDGTGMLQHSIGPVPDRRHGYCLDDNARALILANRLALHPGDEASNLALTCAAFIQHAWNPDAGAFRNFMRFDRSWCEEVGSEDSFGRGIWALGDTVAASNDPALADWARRLYEEALPHARKLGSPRTMAFVTMGAVRVLEAEPDHRDSREVVEQSAAILASLVAASRRPDRAWFEAVLAYDNPRLSQALIEAGLVLDRKDFVATGVETLAWLAPYQRAAGGYFRPVGSESLGREELPPLPFDQQPLEAQAAIEAAAAAHRATGDRQWLEHARIAWEWFLGANDRGVALGDPRTGRCRDGVTPRGANENTGAESILAFHLGYHSLIGLLSEVAGSEGKDGRERQDPRGETAVAGT